MNDDIHELKEQEQGQVVSKKEWDNQHSGLLVGIVFILIGGMLLLNQWTNFEVNNWWALFILIPAFSTIGHAWHVYQRRGRLGHDGGGALTSGLVMLFVASIFLFQLSWSLFWPFILIIIGVSTLLKGHF